MVEKIGCWTLFATHFHELTTLADEKGAVVNRHVSAHVSADDEVTFLYEVKEGACLQSYGVHVARMAHFPTSVVAVAAAKAAELEGFDSSLLSSTAGTAPNAKRQRVDGDNAARNRKLVDMVSFVVYKPSSVS